MQRDYSPRSDDPWAIDGSIDLNSIECDRDKQETTSVYSIIRKIPTIFDSAAKISISILTIALIIGLIFLLYVTYCWISDGENYETTIQPFETPDLGKNLNGTFMAQLLYSELKDIRDLDEISNLTEMDLIEISLDMTSDVSVNPHKDDSRSGYKGTIYNSKQKTRWCDDVSFFSLQTEPIISQLGTIGASGNSLSIGNLLFFLRKQIKKTNQITGSLHKYGLKIILESTFENQSNHSSMSWKVIRTLRNNSSIDEEIPSMLSELAFRIGLYLAEIQGSKKNLPPNWEIYQKLAKGEEYLDEYYVSDDIFDLEAAKDQVWDASNYGYNYQESSAILSDIAIILITKKDNCSEARSILLFCRPFNPVKCDLGLGLAFNKERNYNESITACDRVLQTDPTNIAGLIIRGDSLAGLGNYTESIYDYNSAINNFAKRMYNKSALEKRKLEEVNASILCKKSYALCGLQNYNEALQSLDKATDLGKDLAEAWYWKGWALNERGNYSEANQALDNATKLDQDNFLYWDEKAYALKKMGKNIEAIRACDQGIQLNPYSFYAWYYKGWILNFQGYYEEAIQTLETAIELDSKYAAAWYEKGYALNESGRYEEANVAFAMAEKLGYNI